MTSPKDEYRRYAGDAIALLGSSDARAATLALEHEKFFQAVEASPSSVVITNADGVIEYVNPRFVNSTGYERDQAIGRKPNIMKSGKTPSHVYDDLWATITAGKIWRGELCNRRRNGEHYWEATAIAPIFDENGRPSHYVAVKEDVTERKAVELALQESEHEVRAILDNIVETFYRTDMSGNMMMASAAIEQMLGYKPEELIGNPARNMYVRAADRDGLLRAVNAGGGHVYGYEVQLKRKDGTIIWASINAQHHYGPDDTLIGIEGTMRDITRRKNSERDLLLAKEAAEHANAAKSEFLSGMSHELRTPLNAVIGFAQMMEMQADTTLSEQHREYLSIISTSGEHLLGLINEVLDLSKVEAGRMQMRVAPVEPCALIQDCMDLIKPLATKRGVTLNSPGKDFVVPYIHVDRTKFKQILINLLSNAVKYNVEGGSVHVAVEQDGDARLSISVTDTGRGLHPEQCAALFEPFERFGAERSGVEGTGLGLVLAKRMIEAMGGDITVSSAPEMGSTFTVTVPVAMG